MAMLFLLSNRVELPMTYLRQIWGNILEHFTIQKWHHSPTDEKLTYSLMLRRVTATIDTHPRMQIKITTFLVSLMS